MPSLPANPLNLNKRFLRPIKAGAYLRNKNDIGTHRTIAAKRKEL